MLKIQHFPVVTSDRLASERNEGMSPALCGDIGNPLQYPRGSDKVVSEYGIRLGIDTTFNDAVSGVNLGIGEGVFKDITHQTVHLKTLTTTTPKRITFSASEGEIGIRYDGRSTTVNMTSSFFVQGGNAQLWGNVSALSGFDTITALENKGLFPGTCCTFEF